MTISINDLSFTIIFLDTFRYGEEKGLFISKKSNCCLFSNWTCLFTNWNGLFTNWIGLFTDSGVGWFLKKYKWGSPNIWRKTILEYFVFYLRNVSFKFVGCLLSFEHNKGMKWKKIIWKPIKMTRCPLSSHNFVLIQPNDRITETIR